MVIEALRDRQQELADAGHRIAELATIIVPLERRRETLADLLGAAQADCRAELDAAARADMELVRPRRPRRAATAKPSRAISLEATRDAVVSLDRFVGSELAARLRCPMRDAMAALARLEEELPGIVRRERRGMIQYQPPTTAGAAFELQGRSNGSAAPGVGDLALAGVGQASSVVGRGLAKEIREVVREAKTQGWELVQTGGDHPFRLVKAGRRDIPLESSPRDPRHAANHLRQKLRGRSEARR